MQSTKMHENNEMNPVISEDETNIFTIVLLFKWKRRCGAILYIHMVLGGERERERRCIMIVG